MTTRTIVSGEVQFEATRWAHGLNFPEGPVWVPGIGLLFSDVHGARIYRALPDGGVEPWLDQGIKTNGLALSADGRALIACDHGSRRLLHIELGTRAVTELTTGAEFGGLVNVNDVVVDRHGRAYFTDPDFPSAGRGIPVDQARHAVYLWQPSQASAVLHRVAPAILATGAVPIAALPNGLALSADQKTLYVAFSGEHTVRRYQVADDGHLSGGEICIRLEPGANPDGMTITPDGLLWQTQYGNGRIDAYDPATGRRIHSLQLATGAVTNVAIEPTDRPDQLILWVTAAATPDEPGGKLWRLQRVTGNTD
jgi:gluconolactonase